MKIFFIRHGETTGDVENRYGGVYDDHLSEKGIEQSKQLAVSLKDRGIEKIFVSTLIRAQETSRFLADEIGAGIVALSALQERNQYGFLSGMKKEEAGQKHPEQVEMLKDRLQTIEGAESYEDFEKRIHDVFDTIVSDTSHTSIALVSHGGPLRVLFRDILKWGELKSIGDCAYVELEKNDNKFYWVSAERLEPEFSIEVHQP